MIVVPEPVWELEALLGEGPVWLPREQALRFVDIKRGRLHRYDPDCGDKQTLEVGGQPSFILPERGGSLLVGSIAGVYRLEGDRLGACVAEIDQPAHNRTNDATVDASGRLWFGTMDDAEERETGAVWCLDQGRLTPAGASAVVTNGPAIAGCGDIAYHVDSGQRTIWRFAVDEQARFTKGEVFVRLNEDEGYPDGVVIDSEDCLWVALWDGWGVRRYAPEGTLLLHIAFPCARVTKVAFGGPDLRTAFVTTARVGLDDRELERQPLAGSLFTFASPVAGRVLPEVATG